MKADAISDDASSSRESDFSPVSLHGDGDLGGRRDELRERLEQREAEVDRLKGTIAELELESSDRDALRQQAEQALALTRRRFASVLDENAIHRAQDQSTASKLESLREDLRNAVRLLTESKHKLAVAESALRQRREENAQAWNYLSVAEE